MHKLIDVKLKFNHLVSCLKTGPILMGYLESGFQDIPTIRVDNKIKLQPIYFLTEDVAITLIYNKYLMVIEGIIPEVKGDRYLYIEYKQWISLESSSEYLEKINKYYTLSLQKFNASRIIQNINEQIQLRQFYCELTK